MVSGIGIEINNMLKNLDIEKLKTFIEEEKWGHVKELFKDFINQKLSEDDNAELAAKMAMVIMSAQSALLEEYDKKLDDGLGVLRMINAAERESMTVER